MAGLRCFLHRRQRARQRRRLEKTCEGLLSEVEGLDMFDRAVRVNVTRAAYERFAEHHLHRVEWRCPCGREERAEIQSRLEEQASF